MQAVLNLQIFIVVWCVCVCSSSCVSKP